MEISKKEFTFPCTFKRCFWELDKCVGVKIFGSVIFSCALQFPVMPQAPITAFLLKSPPAPQSIVLVINQKHCNRIIWKQSLEMWGKGGKSILDIDSWARILRSSNKRNFRRNSIRFCEQNIFVIYQTYIFLYLPPLTFSTRSSKKNHCDNHSFGFTCNLYIGYIWGIDG